ENATVAVWLAPTLNAGWTAPLAARTSGTIPVNGAIAADAWFTVMLLRVCVALLKSSRPPLITTSAAAPSVLLVAAIIVAPELIVNRLLPDAPPPTLMLP